MSLIDAFPMRQISKVPNPAGLYAELIAMLLKLAQHGLIHGDFNEFNILIREDSNAATAGTEQEENVTLTPILIDFPQMVSMDHVNAEYYFDRDVNCIKRFFERRFRYTSSEAGPFFKDAKKLVGTGGVQRLDVAVEASGFSRKMAKELETYMKEVGVDGDGDPVAARGDEQSAEDDDEEEEEDAEDEQQQQEQHGMPQESKEKSWEDEPSGLTDALGNDIPISALKLVEKT